MKAIRVKLSSKDHIEHWTVRHVAAVNCTLGRKPRRVQGWQIESADGCLRFCEGNWTALVPYFHLIAGNYGLTSNLS